MRRWHAEAPMLKKWWVLELKNHGLGNMHMWWHIYQATEDSIRYVHGVKLAGPKCHCERGVGSVRKMKPLAHRRSDCMCKMDKNYRLGKKSAWRKWTLKKELATY